MWASSAPRPTSRLGGAGGRPGREVDIPSGGKSSGRPEASSWKTCSSPWSRERCTPRSRRARPAGSRIASGRPSLRPASDSSSCRTEAPTAREEHLPRMTRGRSRSRYRMAGEQEVSCASGDSVSAWSAMRTGRSPGSPTSSQASRRSECCASWAAEAAAGAVGKRKDRTVSRAVTTVPSCAAAAVRTSPS